MQIAMQKICLKCEAFSVGDNLHEMSNPDFCLPRRQIYTEYQTLFSVEDKKNCRLLKTLLHMLIVNM